MNKPNNSLYEYLDLYGYKNIKKGRQTLPCVLAFLDPRYCARIYNISEYFWVVRGIFCLMNVHEKKSKFTVYIIICHELK